MIFGKIFVSLMILFVSISLILTVYRWFNRKWREGLANPTGVETLKYSDNAASGNTSGDTFFLAWAKSMKTMDNGKWMPAFYYLEATGLGNVPAVKVDEDFFGYDHTFQNGGGQRRGLSKKNFSEMKQIRGSGDGNLVQVSAHETSPPFSASNWKIMKYKYELEKSDINIDDGQVRDGDIVYFTNSGQNLRVGRKFFSDGFANTDGSSFTDQDPLKSGSRLIATTSDYTKWESTFTGANQEAYSLITSGQPPVDVKNFDTTNTDPGNATTWKINLASTPIGRNSGALIYKNSEIRISSTAYDLGGKTGTLCKETGWCTGNADAYGRSYVMPYMISVAGEWTIKKGEPGFIDPCNSPNNCQSNAVTPFSGIEQTIENQKKFNAVVRIPENLQPNENLSGKTVNESSIWRIFPIKTNEGQAEWGWQSGINYENNQLIQPGKQCINDYTSYQDNNVTSNTCASTAPICYKTSGSNNGTCMTQDAATAASAKASDVAAEKIKEAEAAKVKAALAIKTAKIAQDKLHAANLKAALLKTQKAQKEALLAKQNAITAAKIKTDAINAAKASAAKASAAKALAEKASAEKALAAKASAAKALAEKALLNKKKYSCPNGCTPPTGASGNCQSLTKDANGNYYKSCPYECTGEGCQYDQQCSDCGAFKITGLWDKIGNYLGQDSGVQKQSAKNVAIDARTAGWSDGTLDRDTAISYNQAINNTQPMANKTTCDVVSIHNNSAHASSYGKWFPPHISKVNLDQSIYELAGRKFLNEESVKTGVRTQLAMDSEAEVLGRLLWKVHLASISQNCMNNSLASANTTMNDELKLMDKIHQIQNAGSSAASSCPSNAQNNQGGAYPTTWAAPDNRPGVPVQLTKNMPSQYTIGQKPVKPKSYDSIWNIF